MEEFLKVQLKCRSVVSKGSPAGGCISEGQTYLIDDTQLVFVKKNRESKAKVMYDGEYTGLQAITETKTIRVPQPIKVLPYDSGGWIFIMENIEMRSPRQYEKELGKKLAQLHLHNISLKDTSTSIHQKEGPSYVDKFGFNCATCCGSIPMPNDWESDWINFYTRHRLQPQVDLIIKEYNDREIIELWSQLQVKVPSFFTGIPSVYPSLLHGDLWSGNTGETSEEPVIFDPASLYGHHEFDLSITKMFGGLDRDFYSSYHSLIPMSPGFETRFKLYLLFHYLNHWNHFGQGYRGQSISLMKQLIST